MQSVADLSYDPQNVRQHDVANIQAIMKSLEEFGQRKPIVINTAGTVIAGNGTLQAARMLGWTEIAAVEVPADWSEEKAKAFAIADNRTAELASWDTALLASQLTELQEYGYELEQLGFTELIDPNEPEQKPDTDPGLNEAYTNIANAPQYEIVGEQPEISELVDTTRAGLLIAEVNKSDLPLELKEFLIRAANRHMVFNYKKIAEFYPHQTKAVQELMEKSALVIIDFNDAIRYGFASLSDSIKQIQKADENAAG